MADTIEIVINGARRRVAADITLAAALMNTGISVFRSSVSGEPRGPVCGMGICFECRVTVDGVPHRRACMEQLRSGMVVETDG
jgi:predicted molibdopterin-dependent oxidoreductase YjgC